jgi:hypothetical protein
MERQQPPRHNHHTHSHLSNNNNNKRKQKTKHHHRGSNNNNNNNSTTKHLQHSPQDAPPYTHQPIVSTPDQNHANYEYIMGDGSHCGDDDENSCNLGKVTISENEETTEHDDDEIGNSYSCDDTLTDDAILSGNDLEQNGKPNGRNFKRNHSHHCEQTSRDSGSGGETCCSCSDTSCVYEEPPSHPLPPSVIQANQALRIGDET